MRARCTGDWGQQKGRVSTFAIREGLFGRMVIPFLRMCAGAAWILSSILGVASCGTQRDPQAAVGEPLMPDITPLPEPLTEGRVSLEETLQLRRSVREFTSQPLTSDEISQLLWAAQGITDPRGRRTAPSAGALYPLELYLVAPQGVFHYDPLGHSLAKWQEGDLRGELSVAALDQSFVADAPATIVITAVFARIEVRYGSERGPRYVHMEVGHAAQNIHLQAVALGLGSVPVGAFHDEQVAQVLALPKDHLPLYLIPVGHPR